MSGFLYQLQTICIFGLENRYIEDNKSKKVHTVFAEVGTNNVISKAQRNKAQRSFQPVKAHRKMRNLIFLHFEVQRNFRNKLFDSVEAQRNSAIVERYLHTKLKRNLTSAIEIS